MKIVNEAVKTDLDRQIALRLDLGCGPTKRSGFYGVDLFEMEGVDIVADLNEGLSDLPENSVSELVSSHAFEHVTEFLSLMKDIHRITRQEGRISITVPHFSNVYGFSDPTHVRFFGLYSMFYFVEPKNQTLARKVPCFYTYVKFNVHSIQIDFYENTVFDKVFNRIFSRFLNSSYRWQEFYERRLAAIFHARQITYVMSPDK